MTTTRQNPSAGAASRAVHLTWIALLAAALLCGLSAGAVEPKADKAKAKAGAEQAAGATAQAPDAKPGKAKSGKAKPAKAKPGKAKPTKPIAVEGATPAAGAAFDPSQILLDPAQRRAAGEALLGKLFAASDPTTLSASSANLIASPSSLVNTLQALWWATRGETALELARLFRAAPGQAPPAPAVPSAAPSGPSPALGGGVVMSFAAGLWIDRRFELKADYLQLLRERGLGSAESVDWADDARSVATVNAWAARSTNGRIPALLEPGELRPPVAFVLTGAVAFQGSWAAPFDAAATRTADFTRLDGTRQPADYLTGERSARTAKLEGGAVLCELAFAGGQYSLVALLPPAGAKPAEILRGWERGAASGALAGWLQRLRPGRVNVAIPKFTMEAAIDPLGALAELGVRRILSEREADFSGASASRGLKLDALKQRAWIAIDERGAEAAAATAAAVTYKGLPPADAPVEFRADRPFLVFIVEAATGEVHFAGRVAAPSFKPAGAAAPATSPSPVPGAIVIPAGLDNPSDKRP